MNSPFSSVLEGPQTTAPLTGPLYSDAPLLYERQDLRDSKQCFASTGIPDAAGRCANFDKDVTASYGQQESLLQGGSSPSGLGDLQGFYTLLSAGALITDVLAQVPSLYTLLKEAIPPLRLAFGERKLLQIEALQSDEDTVLRVMVKLPADTPEPAELLRRFKRDWWLKNARRSEASLVFDYEIGNGF